MPGRCTHGTVVCAGNGVCDPTVAHCPECGRSFDLADQLDADEWFAGHDCEG